MATVNVPFAQSYGLPTSNPANGVAILGNSSATVPMNAQLNAKRSLYVGDLHPDVTEEQLYEKFSKIGLILSIRVCRDAITRRSLGYAYVNFQRAEDAERAMETLNFEPIEGRPIRIMWSQRDPSLRRNTVGNIFIKNLDKRIDVKSLYDTFTLFGKILSCKIATDAEGVSKGYGYIHFETEEAAQIAINKVNGMLLDEKKVYVSKFQPRTNRPEYGDGKGFTNLFVKNFADQLNDEKLHELFAPFGKITSCVVMKDKEGKSRGFGFCNFEKHEDAQNAVDDLNDKVLPGTAMTITVCRAMKKAERETELRRRQDMWKADLLDKYKGKNLYVKNLEDTVDDEALRKLFEEHGTITSARVMRDENGLSRCFGFVCFDTNESATKAKEALHKKINGTKPLYVAFALRKEARRAFLANKFMQKLRDMRLQGPTLGMPTQNMANTLYTPGTGGYFYTPSIQANQASGGFMQSPYQLHAGAPRYGHLGGYMMQGQSTFNNARGPRPNFRRNFHQHQGAQGDRRTGPRNPSYQAKPANLVHPYTVVTSHQPAKPQSATQQANAVNQTSQVLAQPQPLDPQALAMMTPAEQKQLIGEHIFPRVTALCKEGEAPKITGMLIEMENQELLNLLEHDELLKERVQQAVQVLHGNAKEDQPKEEPVKDSQEKKPELV